MVSEGAKRGAEVGHRTDAVGEDDERVLGEAIGVSSSGDEMKAVRGGKGRRGGFERWDKEDQVVERRGRHPCLLRLLPKEDEGKEKICFS